MIEPYVLGGAGFASVWYWILTVVLWALICQRPLGVPYDMILRAERLPEVADRVDFLAHIQAERLNGLREVVGAPAAAAIGFGLAMLAVLGFVYGVEVAQAGFSLTFPMTLVALATTGLAERARRVGARGAELRRMLARRRFWNQVIGVCAVFAATLLALAGRPDLFQPR